MHRRQFLRAAGAAGGAAWLAPFSRYAFAADTPDARLRILLDAFFEENLLERPQSATSWGLDSGAHADLRAKLDDYSAAGRTRQVAINRARLERLRAIPRAHLSPDAQVDHDVIEWSAMQVIDCGARFPFCESPWTPYAVSQLTGPYQSVPDFLASMHPVKSAADADAYLARLAAFSEALDASTSMLQDDAARDVLAPDFVLDLTAAQLHKLRSPPPAASTLVTSLTTRSAEAKLGVDVGAQAAEVVSKRVYPAVERQLAAVHALRAKARPDAGVWKIQDGDAFYAGALAFQTSTTRTPDDVHRLGLENVAQLTSRLDGLLRRQGLTQYSVAQRVNALSRHPDQLYPNTDAGRKELLAALNQQAAAIRERLPEAFRTLPKSPFEIVRVPPEIQDGAPNGYARGASLDGSRPSRYYINLKDTSEWPKFSLPTLTYHESLPGHIWQVSIARESTRIPLIRRLGGGGGGGFAAYGEGWALYAEQLADELGMYAHDPLGRIGFLQSLLFRAVRLVVDTGLHAKRWSRERATHYMVDATAIPRPRVQREIDRYCVLPGQACSYAIGHAEWVRFREQAKQRAGARFDLAAFHDVLLQGRMPLVVLDRVLQAWPVS